MKITWLASYPKSGNTWVRFLLLHYFYGESAEPKDMALRIPDIHAPEEFYRARETQPRLLVKTHRKLTPQMPHFADTARAIYIVRNPRDVLLSFLNYVRLVDGLPSNVTDAHYARLFIGRGGDPVWYRSGSGSWEANVVSWTVQKHFPLLLVRYSDLKEDAPLQLRRMLEFMGEEVDEGRVHRAAELSSFDRLRALEIREKENPTSNTVFAGGRQAMLRGRMFVNKGHLGGSLAAVGSGLDEAFDQRFGEAMRRLGVDAPGASGAVSA